MPRLSAYVEKNPEHFSFSGNFLVAEKTRLAEDVPLASFDRIISAMEKEISAGRLRQVFDLNFGYTDAGQGQPSAFRRIRQCILCRAHLGV